MADLFEGLEEPIFLVTTDLGKRIRPLGQIVSGVSKASLGGRTITLCLSKFGFTAKVIVERTKCFTLHLLAESNHDLVRLFGTETGRNVDKFDKIQHLLSKDRFGDVIEHG
ncbi:hypothetical protein BC832DRAFT_107025 [Gaertneriomyces semiglobifer]|nr:hypothetical protein BC832DRAFT_107025 [Gaertneriomyces semiglobifer]